VWAAAKSAVCEPQNYILNPCFQSSQENGDAVMSVSTCVLDAWWLQTSTSSCSAQRVAAVSPPNASKYALQMSVLTPIASAAAGDYASLYQFIEGQWIQNFFQGTAYAKYAVLRFWVKASHAGTYGGALRSMGTARSYPFAYTISSGQVNTWVMVQINIPGDTGGTATNWPKDNTYCAILWFTFFAGTNWRATPSTWAVSNAIAPTGINAVLPSGGVFQIADVGFYRDSLLAQNAPRWVPPDDLLSRRQAMRYWYKAKLMNGASNTSTLAGRMGMPHPVAMRAVPAQAEIGTMTVSDMSPPVGVSAVTAVGNSFCGESNITTASGLTVGNAATFTNPGSSSANYIAMNAM